MSLPVGSPQLPPPGQSELAGAAAQVFDLRPRPDEGVFLPDENIEDLYHEITVDRDTEAIRRHDLVRVNDDDYLHVMWVTEPVEPQADSRVVIAQPGLGETIEDGIGFKFHTELARRLPEAVIISHNTHGIGHHGQHLSNRELRHHTMKNMGEHNLKLYQKYLDGREIIPVGTSMGTVINNRMLLLNKVTGNPLRIRGVVNFATALVPPERVAVDMAGKFPVEMMADGFTESFARTRLCHFLGMVSTMGRSGMRWDDGRVIAREAVDLLCGVHIEDIREATEAYPTVVINGVKCSIGQLAMWLGFEQDIDGLDVHPIPGRGHAIAMKPIESARKIGGVIRQRQWAGTQLTA